MSDESPSDPGPPVVEGGNGERRPAEEQPAARTTSPQADEPQPDDSQSDETHSDERQSDGPQPDEPQSDEPLPGTVAFPVLVQWRPSTIAVGDSLGPYHLLEVLGEGGMGIVYLAEQEEPRRRVALKLIRSSRLEHPEARARFAAERQALARFTHPHIAQIYDSGTASDGTPFFVMELVAGEPITRYCDRARLGLEERLRLYSLVCRAVEHAHQKGIIHRDLKPSNVLVAEIDGRPTPKVIDFGLAKALDQPLVDATILSQAQVLGTPSYLSPESLEAAAGEVDVDTRTDVYSLGILLYELVAGARPFEDRRASMAQVLRRIADQEPPRPSARFEALDEDSRTSAATARALTPAALDLRLRGDLDWIVLKAIAKRRDDRYASAGEVAAEVARFLSDQPLLARPPSLRYRLGKLVRRHRVAAAAIVVALAALVLGVLGTTAGMVRASREARAAEEALAESRELSSFLTDLFEVSDPGPARGATITARELLATGAARIRSGFADRPLARARFMDTIGEVYTRLGLYKDAAPLLEEALELREHSDLPVPVGELATSLDALAELDVRRGRFDEGEALHRRALSLREGDKAGPDPAGLARSLHGLCDDLRFQGRFKEALEECVRAASLREEALGPKSPELANTFSTMASIDRRLDRLDEAESLYQRAVAILEAAYGPDDFRLAVIHNNLAIVYWSKARLGEAERTFRSALATYARVLGDDNPRVARVQTNLGMVLSQEGKYDEAEPLLRRSIATREAAFGPDNMDVSMSLQGLGIFYLQQGRFSEAEGPLSRSLEIAMHHSDKDYPGTGQPLLLLGAVRNGQGRYAEAEELFAKAEEVIEKTLPPDHSERIDSLRGLADSYRGLGRFADARATLDQALGILEGGEKPGDPSELAWTLRGLANLLRDQGRFDEAVPVYERAMAFYDKAPMPDALDPRPIADDYAILRARMGKAGQAAPPP